MLLYDAAHRKMSEDHQHVPQKVLECIIIMHTLDRYVTVSSLLSTADETMERQENDGFQGDL